MNTPFFSIIIPAFNAVRYLQETIDSVCAQTDKDWELLIVDDGSTDNTRMVVEGYHDTRISYFYQNNQGQSVARNNGLNHARGRYVTFLDADNILLSHACERVRKEILRDNAHDVYYGDLRYFDVRKPKELLKFTMHYIPKITLRGLIEHNTINLLGTFIKRDLLVLHGAFNDAFRRSDEQYLWISLIFHDARFFYIDEVMGHLRFHMTNLSFEPHYLLETAETNLTMFAWLQEECAKKYVGKTFIVLCEAIERATETWLLKRCIGALMIQQKTEAISSLRRWGLHAKRSPFIIAILVCGIRLCPSLLFPPVFSFVRMKMIMRKYVIVPSPRSQFFVA